MKKSVLVLLIALASIGITAYAVVNMDSETPRQDNYSKPQTEPTNSHPEYVLPGTAEELMYFLAKDSC